MRPAPQRIVLVDDEEALVWSLASRLAKARPSDIVETACDGAEALRLMLERPADLLIADVRMPGMSGIDLIVTVRKERTNMPAIVMTAFPSPEMNRVTPGPFTGFLEKPFEFEHLLDLVDTALRSERVGFSGAISVQTLPDIVQLYALSSATGVLVVRHQTGEGEVWFDIGMIRHARTHKAVGEDAFHEIMGWSGGEFTMRVGAKTPERSITANWQELVMESCRRTDEGDRGDGRANERSGWTLVPPPSEDRSAAATDSFDDLFDDPDLWASVAVPTPSPPKASKQATIKEAENMNIKDSLSKIGEIDGFIGAALVDSESGMLLGQEAGGGINMEVAAAGNSEVVKAKRKTMANLGLKDQIDDILISLGKHYHIIRPLRTRPGLFFYVALDRARGNLALARIALADVEKELVV